MATTVTDTMYAGDKRVLGFTITDEEDAALDLTGKRVVYRLAKQAATGTPPFFHAPALVEKSSDADDGIEITDAAGGECEVTLAGADTAGLAGEYVFHLLVYTDDDPVTVVDGTVTISRSVPAGA